MRLIDADKIEYVWNMNDDFIAFKEDIDEMPIIDAVPVVHGNWILHHAGAGHYWECSVCHKNPDIYITEHTHYCPNCGARMDEVVE